MNPTIETLNHWSGWYLNFVWPMFWQSSLLILVLFAIDFAIRRSVRASIRYALWLVVLVKLCLPPTLASPTSPAWWWHKTPPIAAAQPHYTVTYGTEPLPETSRNAIPVYVPPKPAMTIAAWLLVTWGGVGVLLLVWLLIRWRRVTRQVRRATHSERLSAILNQTCFLVAAKSRVPVKLTENSMSPAVCGLFRPVILIPKSLAEGFSGEQLQIVLLHELVHLRRCDVWVNFLQALLQVLYWWHPLLWLANARIRRVREEAVDDAVMLALRDQADSYASTLLEVAKLALNRPLASLGLVGILESRSALRQRIERLVNFRASRKAGLTFASICCVFAFSAAALPMGEAPGPVEKSDSTDTVAGGQESLTLKVNPEIFIQNVKAQAAKSLLSPTNDYTVILLDLVRSEGVDCTPPNGIAFNTRSGEITTQNTPDKLDVFRRVIEQLNRADGQCRLPLGNNPLRKQVLIEARVYQMPDTDFEQYVSGLQFYHGSRYGSDWWSASPEKFKQLIAELESSGLHLIQRPRIQTGSGITTEFFVGNKTNSLEFDCKPYVGDGFVDLALQGTVVGVTPASTAFTNFFRAKASAENRGGVVVRVKNYGGEAGNNLVAVISLETVTNTVHFQERLQAIISRPDGAKEEVATNLLVRTFKVNTRVFVANLKRMDAGFDGDASSPAAVSTAVRKFFASLGVNWDSPAGKAVFFNDQTGMLLMRATPSDLDAAEQAVQALNYTDPLIHIKARFIEIGPGKTIRSTNQPKKFQMVGIMTPENVKTVLRAANVKELDAPDVTTTSGRRTEMRSTEIVTVITNFVFTEGSNSQPNSITPQIAQVETGPVVDTVATVLPDGYTVDLKTTASVTEFLGYDQPTNTVVKYTASGKKINLPTVLPRFDIQKKSAHVKLWDGQTVVLGGMIRTATQTEMDKVPVLGDLPVIGRLFQSQTRVVIEKNLILFITVTIVDPAGNRVHSDSKMPFAKNSFPPQDGR
jgi:beta-lactamase regulating signal transducer with metallopeptidase domain/Flp pilus assembly secretin CpaC